MKKYAAIIMTILFLTTFLGCGDTKTINDIEYDTYGLLDVNEKKNPDIEYKLIIGNIVWSIILFETVIAPVYFIGFSLYEPIEVKDHNRPVGAI